MFDFENRRIASIRLLDGKSFCAGFARISVIQPYHFNHQTVGYEIFYQEVNGKTWRRYLVPADKVLYEELYDDD